MALIAYCVIFTVADIQKLSVLYSSILASAEGIVSFVRNRLNTRDAATTVIALARFGIRLPFYRSLQDLLRPACPLDAYPL